jgi:hypothetical protein
MTRRAEMARRCPHFVAPGRREPSPRRCLVSAKRGPRLTGVDYCVPEARQKALVRSNARGSERRSLRAGHCDHVGVLDRNRLAERHRRSHRCRRHLQPFRFDGGAGEDQPGCHRHHPPRGLTGVRDDFLPSAAGVRLSVDGGSTRAPPVGLRLHRRTAAARGARGRLLPVWLEHRQRHGL